MLPAVHFTIALTREYSILLPANDDAITKDINNCVESYIDSDYYKLSTELLLQFSKQKGSGELS